MQKLLLTILLFLFFRLTMQAQIQLTVADLPTVHDGYKIYYRQVKTEDLKEVNPGDAGDNVVWDFSSLSGGIKDSTIFADPLTYDPDLYKLFPSASLVSITNEGTFYFELSENNSRNYEIFLGGKDIAVYEFSPSLLIMDLPISKGDYYSGEGIRIMQVDPTHRMRISTEKKDTVDAWGELKTPTGDYEALRIISYVTYTTFNEVKDGDNWIVVNQDQNKVIEYNWWAKDVGKEVFKLSYTGVNAESPSLVNWFTEKQSYVVSSMVDQSMKNEMLVVGPNPTSGPLQFFSTSGSTIVSVLIKDVGGKTVFNENSGEPISFVDLSSLSEGFYYMELKDSEGKNIVKKVSLVK